MRYRLRAWLYDWLTDPVLPVIVILVALVIGVMLAQYGCFGPRIQWMLRPDAIE